MDSVNVQSQHVNVMGAYGKPVSQIQSDAGCIPKNISNTAYHEMGLYNTF